MVKLSKTETNELIKEISNYRPFQGLVLKLMYVYGKTCVTVLKLKWFDVDLDKNLIYFKGDSFPLLPDLKQDILDYCSVDMEYLFVKDDSNSEFLKIQKQLKYYLNVKVKKLNVSPRVKRSNLSLTDFRRLRAQHLILDGVDIHIVLKLYQQYDGMSTQFKKYIGYDDLYRVKFPCEDLVDVFDSYTDLDVFGANLDVREQFIVCSDLEETIVEFNHDTGDVVFFEDIDEDVCGSVVSLFSSGCLDSIFRLSSNEYKVIGGLKFIRL